MSTGEHLMLAGDLGGTKTDLIIFSPQSGPRAPLVEASFPSAGYSRPEALVSQFLSQVQLHQKIDRASFGVAGPVVGGHAKITNLPWVLNESQLREALNLSQVRLLNDLQAVACAVPHLYAQDLYTLNAGQPAVGGAKAVIAPGTGLGQAYLVGEGSRYRAYASEGGHADFAPNSVLEIELLKYLQQRFGHISYERVCSGIGLPHIYAFLKESGYDQEPSWLAEELTAAKDPTPVIVSAALDEQRRCRLCAATLEVFSSVLGAAAGNWALHTLATGGVYLGGGLSRRILPVLRQGHFMQSFQSKGRLSHLMEQIPLEVILNPKAALLGAAYHGLEELEAKRSSHGARDRSRPPHGAGG
jgi:glucokinase